MLLEKMNQMYCNYCGTKLEEGITTCPHCGQVVTKVKVPEKEKYDTGYSEINNPDGKSSSYKISEDIENKKIIGRYCLYCGEKIEIGSNTCTKCNRKIISFNEYEKKITSEELKDSTEKTVEEPQGAVFSGEKQDVEKPKKGLEEIIKKNRRRLLILIAAILLLIFFKISTNIPVIDEQTLVDQNGVTITAKDINKMGYPDWELELSIENNSGRRLIIYTDYISVNGSDVVTMDRSYIGTVRDGSIVYRSIKFGQNQLDEYYLGEITEIKISFIIEDTHDLVVIDSEPIIISVYY